MRYTALFVPGTFEPISNDGRPTGMLRKVYDLLPVDKFHSLQIKYPMSYGSPTAYEDSVASGVRALVAAIRATPNVAVLIGYSQGAAVIARLLQAIRRGEFRDLEIAMAVLVANPERRESEGVGNVPGSGIAGGRTLAGCPFPVVQLALPDDAITSASKDSLWRDVADLSQYMSGDVVRWANQALGKITSGRMQNFTRVENLLWMLGRSPARVVTAVREISGYLGRPSIHTLYGVRKVPGTGLTYLEYAAERLRSV